MNTRFTIPQEFLELERSGRFDYWGAPYKTLTDKQREVRLASHLTQVLWWRPIEWDSTSAAILAFDGDDYLRPGLIPFAGNGCGDQYCWYPRWQTDASVPVILALHDESKSGWFARDFAECLCRCLLQNFADAGPSDQSIAAEVLWDAHFEILRPFLDSAQVELLRRVRSDFSPATCAAADEEIAARLPVTTLETMQPPIRYDHEHLDRQTLLRLYDQSSAFFRELVEVEGRSEFMRQLEQVEASRATV